MRSLRLSHDHVIPRLSHFHFNWEANGVRELKHNKDFTMANSEMLRRVKRSGQRQAF